MKLFGANDAIRLITTSVATLDVVAFHATTDGTTTTHARAQAKINSATTTVLVAAPGVDLTRTVYQASVRNTHASVSNTVTVQLFDGTNAYEIAKVILGPGEQLSFDGLGAWQYLNAAGMPKVNSAQGSQASVLGEYLESILSADVINNNAVANSIADVTGLSFPVIAGETYRFEFFIDYTAAATTTGSRWTINGPAFSRLAYRSQYSLTTASGTFNTAVAYDQPAASNASSAVTTGNIAKIEGLITPSADGNVIARFASEIAASAITAKRGSVVRWKRVL